MQAKGALPGASWAAVLVRAKHRAAAVGMGQAQSAGGRGRDIGSGVLAVNGREHRVLSVSVGHAQSAGEERPGGAGKGGVGWVAGRGALAGACWLAVLVRAMLGALCAMSSWDTLKV